MPHCNHEYHQEVLRKDLKRSDAWEKYRSATGTYYGFITPQQTYQQKKY
jgi:hypothetical protein